MTSFSRHSLLGSAAALLVPLLASAPAHANVVTVGGMLYEIALSSIPYNSNTSLFNAAPLGQMPWWGDGQLASAFAAEVFDQLGANLFQPGYGAVFAYGTGGTVPGEVYAIVQNTLDINDQLDLDPSSPLSMVTAYPFAIATLSSPVPVPAPLPVFGFVVGSVWARRLRCRSRAARQQGVRDLA